RTLVGRGTMCELMGLCFAAPVSADFSIREFAKRDEQNADGWGLAWYPDRSAAIVKEPISWRASKHTQFLADYHAIRSALYIAHVRHKTVGGDATHADTHPFTRELDGRDYCFAHNGTLLDLSVDGRAARYHPLGHTDSERAFCQLLDALSRRNGNLRDEDGWQWLAEYLQMLNRHGRLNCLLSDGEALFCYRDTAGYKNLTWRAVDVYGPEVRRFEDSEVQIDLDGQSSNHGVLVASNPLSSAGWENFRPGELIVLRGGELQFSSHGNAGVGKAPQPRGGLT
ncbi:MAG: class II glutamine amidotransferase, partial [Pirellulales bacterium]